MVPAPPKVFISYSRESQEHLDRVLALADRLETFGVEVLFDQYEPNPTEGWPKWMEACIRESQYIICVCTNSYKEKVDNQLPAGVGLGLQWEGSLIYSAIQSKRAPVNKFQVVQFGESQPDAIPLPLVAANRHLIEAFDLNDANFEALYRIITDQPKAIRPERGELVKLEPIQRTSIPRSGSETTVFEIDRGEQRPSRHSNRKVAIAPANYRPRKLVGKGSYIAKLGNTIKNYAMVAARKGDYKEAISLILQAQKLDPMVSVDYRQVAEWYRFLHDYAEANSWYAAAAKVNDDWSLKLDLLDTSFLAGTCSDPSSQAKELFEAHKGSVDSYMNYSMFLGRIGNYEGAIEVLKSYSGAENVSRLRMQLAVYLWFAGHTQESIEIFDESPKKSFTSIDWLNYGVGQAELHRFGLAIESIRMGLARDPDHHFGDYALAQIYAQMQETAMALVNLEKLLARESYYLLRVREERTFDPIRQTAEFQDFLFKLQAWEDQRGLDEGN